ncbi:MAG: hypothetical protein V3580_03995 [Candidatus Cardinium sp.]|nr:hypothetical protein [Candidatus Cardinium sp.]
MTCIWIELSFDRVKQRTSNASIFNGNKNITEDIINRLKLDIGRDIPKSCETCDAFIARVELMEKWKNNWLALSDREETIQSELDNYTMGNCSKRPADQGHQQASLDKTKSNTGERKFKCTEYGESFIQKNCLYLSSVVVKI